LFDGRPNARPAGKPLMPTHVHANPHDHHRVRVEIPLSLLRLSALQRIAIATFLSALLWGAVVWAVV
jgi:hypothetical protein